MSKGWQSRDGAERQRLRRRFALLAFAESAAETGLDEPGSGVSFGRLYDAARGGVTMDAELAAALLGDPALRADFDLLLERTARHRLPRAAVASSGELHRRETAGLVVKLVRSRANPAQVYVLIEVESGRDEAVLIVKTAAGEYLKEVLPSPESGTVRLLKSVEDPFTQALRDATSEVFLL